MMKYSDTLLFFKHSLQYYNLLPLLLPIKRPWDKGEEHTHANPRSF